MCPQADPPLQQVPGTATLLLQLLYSFPAITLLIQVLLHLHLHLHQVLLHLHFHRHLLHQVVLLAWLHMADILNHPFGFNKDFDMNLTEVNCAEHEEKNNNKAV